jgi:hypothetical protein
VLHDFAPALGEPGIAEIERLVAPRGQCVDRQSWTGGFAVRDPREQLAEVSGDRCSTVSWCRSVRISVSLSWSLRDSSHSSANTFVTPR